MAEIRRESVEDALENDRCGICLSVDHFREDCPDRCPKCDGCGRIGTDDEGTPWTFWENLPVKSAAAVILGFVRPITCPRCGGSGRISAEATSG